MEPEHEAQESARGGAWQVGRLGQKPQEDHRRAAQRPPAPSRSSQEVLSMLIALIQARFGDVAIGLGEHGIRYRAVAAR
jgi:hypothetical protein